MCKHSAHSLPTPGQAGSVLIGILCRHSNCSSEEARHAEMSCLPPSAWDGCCLPSTQAPSFSAAWENCSSWASGFGALSSPGAGQNFKWPHPQRSGSSNPTALVTGRETPSLQACSYLNNCWSPPSVCSPPPLATDAEQVPSKPIN